MTDWWQCQKKKPLCCLAADGWLSQVACLRSLMKWRGLFSTWQNIPFPSQTGFWMPSISDRSVCHTDRRHGPRESHQVAVMLLSTTERMTPVTRERLYSQGTNIFFCKNNFALTETQLKKIEFNLFLKIVWSQTSLFRERSSFCIYEIQKLMSGPASNCRSYQKHPLICLGHINQSINQSNWIYIDHYNDQKGTQRSRETVHKDNT